MDPLFDVSDRIVVITGGLGQLGSAYAAAFLQRGARVALLDMAAGEDLARQRLGRLSDHDNLLLCQADVTQAGDLQAALAAIRARFGIPNVLINNAAIDSPPNAPLEENGPFESYPMSSWRRVMEVNIDGVFLCSQVFGGAMAAQGDGSIVNISSIYGLVSPDQSIYEYRRRRGEDFYKPAAYATSKSALLNLTRYLATYWAKRDVRVNTLSLAGVFAAQESGFLDAYCARIPVGRMAKAEDYIGAMIFLAAPASRYMTGANLVVDGGWTAI